MATLSKLPPPQRRPVPQRSALGRRSRGSSALHRSAKRSLRRALAQLAGLSVGELLDLAWDIATAAFSVVDVSCDVLVARSFYTSGCTKCFAASVGILVFAQASYAYVYVDMHLPLRATHTRIVKTFFAMLPFAQFLPVLIWLETFDLHWVKRLLADLGLVPARGEKETKYEDDIIKYINRKFVSHRGFILEALTESIPQCVLQTAMFCTFPHLASPLHAYSILVSLTVIASKAYVFAFSRHRPTFCMKFVSTVADLLNLFATTAWIFAGSAFSHEFGSLPLLWHAQRFVLYGVLACYCCFLADRINGYLDARWWKQGGKDSLDLMCHCVYDPLFVVLATVPVMVFSVTCKFSALTFIPFAKDKTMKSSADGSFERKIVALLPSSLSMNERERRLRIINLFTLFAEVRSVKACGQTPKTWRDSCRQDVHRHLVWGEPLESHSSTELLAAKAQPSTSKSAKRRLKLQARRQAELADARAALAAASQGTEQLTRAITASLDCPAYQRQGCSWKEAARNVRDSFQRWFLGGLAVKPHTLGPRSTVEMAASASMWASLGAALLLGALAAMHGAVYWLRSLLFPAMALVRNQMVGGVAMPLQSALSVGFVLCLLVMMCCVPSVLAAHFRSFDLVWRTDYSGAKRLPTDFHTPETAAVLATTIREQSERAEHHWLLRQAGLPHHLATEVMHFVDVGRKGSSRR